MNTYIVTIDLHVYAKNGNEAREITEELISTPWPDFLEDFELLNVEVKQEEDKEEYVDEDQEGLDK